MAKKQTIEQKVKAHKKLTLEEKIERQYAKYSEAYSKLKKQKITKKNTRKLGKKQFESFVKDQLNNVPGATITSARKVLIEEQNKFGDISEAKIRLAYKVYQQNGNKTASATYWGENGTGRGGTDNQHHVYTSIETFKAGITTHQMIALLVQGGLTPNEALEEYGY